MPDGLTHRKIWKAFLPVAITTAILLVFIGWWYFAIFYLVGYGLHAFGFEPDLDLNGINNSEAFWIKSVIFIPLVAMSTFYARVFQHFGGHRSFWTHGLFISSFIRLFYFTYPLLWFIRYRLHYTDALWYEYLAMFSGLSFADSLHIIADMITGEMAFGGRFGGKNKFLKGLMKKYFDYPPKGKGKINLENQNR